MFVIGIDSHKDTLMGCVIDQALRQVGTRCVPNTSGGRARLVAWARETGAGRVAIEGSGHYGRPAALALVEAGIEVVEVPPQMTSRQRRRQRTPVKNDSTDALLIARVAAPTVSQKTCGFWSDTAVNWSKPAPARSTGSTPISPNCAAIIPNFPPLSPTRPLLTA